MIKSIVPIDTMQVSSIITIPSIFLNQSSFSSIPLAVLLFIVLGGRYCGLGTNIINNCFNDGTVYSYDFILKIAFTVITLSIGFQGGEVTPLFAIGASLGYVLGGVMGLNPVCNSVFRLCRCIW